MSVVNPALGVLAATAVIVTVPVILVPVTTAPTCHSLPVVLALVTNIVVLVPVAADTRAAVVEIFTGAISVVR